MCSVLVLKVMMVMMVSGSAGHQHTETFWETQSSAAFTGCRMTESRVESVLPLLPHTHAHAKNSVRFKSDYIIYLQFLKNKWGAVVFGDQTRITSQFLHF